MEVYSASNNSVFDYLFLGDAMAKHDAVLPRQVVDNTKKIPLNKDLNVEILRSPVSSDRIMSSLEQGKSIFTDSRKNLGYQVFQDILHHNIPAQIAFCFRNSDIYSIEFVEILAKVLDSNSYHPILKDQILTASQEAFANAFLWSSLDLDSIKGIRPIEFFQNIEDRLQDPIYSNRYMGVYFAKHPNILEIAIYVEGRPIVWPKETSKDKFRGVSLIQSLTDKVQIDTDGKVIRLFFLS